MKVLIADDDDSVIDFLTEVVVSLNHEVYTARTGKQVIELHDNIHPDLIITDHRMGLGYTGLDVLKLLKKQFTDSLIVILTAHGDIQLAVEAMKEGAFDFVTKSIDFVGLQDIVKRAFAAKNIPENKENVKSLEEMERESIQLAVNECQTFQDAANKLGMHIVTLHRKRKLYGIQRQRNFDAEKPLLTLVEKPIKKIIGDAA